LNIFYSNCQRVDGKNPQIESYNYTDPFGSTTTVTTQKNGNSLKHEKERNEKERKFPQGIRIRRLFGQKEIINVYRKKD